MIRQFWLSEQAEAEVQAADSATKETAELQEKDKALKIQYASEVASY
jgi:hypothetical protein